MAAVLWRNSEGILSKVDMLITAVGPGILHHDSARVLPATSTTVMPDILYIVLKIHALTAPFLLTFSCMPCQRFIVNELMYVSQDQAYFMQL